MTRPPRRAGVVDSSVRDAHEVVGLYGDPDTTWGICAELTVARPVDPDAAAERMTRLCHVHQHLGAPPRVRRPETPTGASWERLREDVASAPYLPGGPLVRLALDDEARRLVVGAHHGVVDGLGLLAVAAEALGAEVRATARGIGGRPAARGFALSSLLRMGEAALSPPPRFPGVGHGSPREPLEDLSSRVGPPGRRGTRALAMGVLGALAGHGASARDRRAVLVVGASRRVAPTPTPDRQTAFLRLRLPPDATAEQVARALADTPPEPDFPETSARGIGPAVVRLFRSRLGATAMLSNLGRIEAADLVSVAMFPASSGPRAVAVGLASTEHSTTISLRTRRRDFSREEHERLLDQLCEAFQRAR